MALGVLSYPANLDDDASIGGTSGIIAGSTPLGATGPGQGDELGITKNLINSVIALEVKAGITNSLVTTSLDYRIRKYPFKVWVAELEGSPTAVAPATSGLRNARPILAFNDAAINSILFFGAVPLGAILIGGLTVRYTWMAATATTGNVVWGVEIERLATDEDSDSFDTQAPLTAAPSGTNGVAVTSPITITTIDSLSAGDSFCLRVQRVANSGSDTMIGDAQLQFVSVESAT